MIETVSPVHWLPVIPKMRLSTRRKSSSTRVAPYHAPNVSVSTPSLRGLRESRYRAKKSSVARIMSYNAVWWTPVPVPRSSPVGA